MKRLRCCVALQRIPWATHYTHLLSLYSDLMTDQSADTTDVQLDKPMRFYWGYSQEYNGLLSRAKMTQRQLHQQSTLQHEFQLIKAGDLNHTAQPAGNSVG